MVVAQQDTPKNCAVATTWMALTAIAPNTKTEYDAVKAGLRDKKYAQLNYGTYIHEDAVKGYLEEHPDLVRHGVVVRKIYHGTVDRLELEIRRTGLPVVVGYRVTPFHPGHKWLNVVLLPWAAVRLSVQALTLFNSDPLGGLTHGEYLLADDYPHASLVVGIYSVEDTEDRVVLLADPWAGVALISDAAPNLDPMSESDFMSRWGASDFRHLSSPRSMLVFRKPAFPPGLYQSLD